MADQLKAGQISSALDDLFEDLAGHREEDAAAWPKLARRCSAHPLRDLLLTDPFTWRAFAKPRGYAGDAVMMDYIYGLGDDDRGRPEAAVGRIGVPPQLEARRVAVRPRHVVADALRGRVESQRRVGGRVDAREAEDAVRAHHLLREQRRARCPVAHCHEQGVEFHAGGQVRLEHTYVGPGGGADGRVAPLGAEVHGATDSARTQAGARRRAVHVHREHLTGVTHADRAGPVGRGAIRRGQRVARAVEA